MLAQQLAKDEIPTFLDFVVTVSYYFHHAGAKLFGMYCVHYWMYQYTKR